MTGGKYPIDRNEPIPETRAAGRPDQYPWACLAVGDSFLVPSSEVKAKSVRSAVSRANSRYPDKRFISRSVDGGVRVWRTE